jgi:actin-like ATPase involved in cell morphogenesis
MSYTLGIDIGTTFSGAAIARDGRADIFPLSTERATIPTVVLLRADSEVLVGDAAERRALTEPTRVAREFKRRMGDPTPVIVGGTPYGVEALYAHVLRWIVARVVEQEGGYPDAVALTHPATWGTYKLDLLAQAARLADLADAHLVPEPQAAATRYAREGRVKVGDVVAVYDFGGGTFDVALVRSLGGDDFELVGSPEGMERLGGIDFDQAVYAHVDGALDGMLGEAEVSDPAVRSALARLRTECRAAKEALSSDTDAVIPVMLPQLQTSVRLTRGEFEGMIRPRITETIDTLERTVRGAGLATRDLAAVLLVGGTSRIPLIREMIHSATGVPVTLDSHPKFTIPFGAALLMEADLAAVAAADPVAAEPQQAPTGGQAATAGTAVEAPPPPPEAEPAVQWIPGAPAARAGLSRRTLLWGGAAIAAAVIAILAIILSKGGGDGTAMSVTTQGTSVVTTTTIESTTVTSDTTVTTTATTVASTTAAPVTTVTAAPGYTTVLDATRALSFAAPDGWAQIDSQPLVFLGASRPHISATSDLAGYVNTWNVPGISVIVVDRTAAGNATLLLDNVDLAVGYSQFCVFGAADTYADARFGGEIRAWSDCAGSGNMVVAVAADDGRDVLYLVVVVALTDQDLAALEEALATLSYSV